MKSRLYLFLAMVSTFLVGTYWAYDASRLYIYRAGDAGSYTYNLLFDSAVIAIPIAMFLGILLGAIKGNEHDAEIKDGKVLRHDETMFIKHWTHVMGTLLLIVTGIGLGTLIIPRTIATIETVGFFLNLHFLGIIFFLFGVAYYVTNGLLSGELKEMMPKKGDIMGAINHYKGMFFGGKMPKERKFMAVERVIFPFWILGVGGITITGAIKVLAHVWSIPGAVMGVTTFFHGVFAVFMALMVVAHVIGGSMLPASWPLFRSMLTGYVSEKYAKSHHELWYEELSGNKTKESEETVNKKNKLK